MQKKSPRHLSRSLAVQAIYYNKFNCTPIIEIERFLNENNNTVYNSADYDLMHFIIEQSINNFDKYLALYSPYLTRDIDQINPIEQIILVIAATELLNSINIPAAVIINEAVELTKFYGAEESHRFINGLVDKIANDIRRDEINHYNKIKNHHKKYKRNII
jgi:N utilization substance protein B